MVKVCLTKKRMKLALKVLAGILVTVLVLSLVITLWMHQQRSGALGFMTKMTMGLWYVAFSVHEVLEMVYGYSKNELIRSVALMVIGVTLVALGVAYAVMVPEAFAMLWVKCFLGIVLVAVTACVLYMLISAWKDVRWYKGLCEEFGVPEATVPFKEYVFGTKAFE